MNRLKKHAIISLSTVSLLSVLTLSGCGSLSGDTPFLNGSAHSSTSSSASGKSGSSSSASSSSSSDKSSVSSSDSKSSDSSKSAASSTDGSKGGDTEDKGVADGYYDGVPIEQYAKEHGMKIDSNGNLYKDQEAVTDSDGNTTTKDNAGDTDTPTKNDTTDDNPLYSIDSSTSSTVLSVSNKLDDALAKGDYKAACKYVTFANKVDDCASVLKEKYSDGKLEIKRFTKENMELSKYDIDTIAAVFKGKPYESNGRTMFLKEDGTWKVLLAA